MDTVNRAEQSYLLNNFDEHLGNSLLRLCARLHEEHSPGSGPVVSHVSLNDSRLIHLVAHQQLHDFLSSTHAELLDLLEPHTQRIEGFLPGHVVHQDDSLGASVVRAGQCTETLLSSCREKSQQAKLQISNHIDVGTIEARKPLPVSQIVTFTRFILPSGLATSMTFTLKSTPATSHVKTQRNTSAYEVSSRTDCALKIFVEISISELEQNTERTAVRRRKSPGRKANASAILTWTCPPQHRR